MKKQCCGACVKAKNTQPVMDRKLKVARPRKTAIKKPKYV